MSTLAVNTITNATGGNTATINGMTPTAQSLQGFRNRIINGDMRIDQRNNGAVVTPGFEVVTYITDRFYFIRSSSTSPTLQRSTDAPAGFTNSLLFTNASTGTTPTYAQVVQRVEGFNVADLGWGAAGAATVTVSFWVKSSVTGTYSISLRNSASNRSYVSTYAISAANTWEQKTVTIPGDTTGTWLKDNGNGIELIYRFGGSGGTSSLNTWTATGEAFASGATNVMGTANATWQLTGVQLEAGSVATPFERRPYGTELALCQRYYWRMTNTGSYLTYGSGFNSTTTNAHCSIQYPVVMRAVPSLQTTGTASNYIVLHGLTLTACSAVPEITGGNQISAETARITFAVASGLTAGQGSQCASNLDVGFLAFASEL